MNSRTGILLNFNESSPSIHFPFIRCLEYAKDNIEKHVSS